MRSREIGADRSLKEVVAPRQGFGTSAPLMLRAARRKWNLLSMFSGVRSKNQERCALLLLLHQLCTTICSTCTDLKLCWWCLLRTINKAIQRCLEARATSPLHGIWTLTICCSKRNLSISFDSTSSQSCRAAAAVPSPPLTTHPDRHSGSRSSWGRSSVDRHTRGEGKPPLMKGCQQQIH